VLSDVLDRPVPPPLHNRPIAQPIRLADLAEGPS
jgi:hypothetical protein